MKRGLRDATGRGVLTSLTRISEVKGYTVDGQDTIPCPGVLYYRGYDVRDLVQGALADKRFGFEEVFYLLREDKRFTDLEAWATRFTPCRTPGRRCCGASWSGWRRKRASGKLWRRIRPWSRRARPCWRAGRVTFFRLYCEKNGSLPKEELTIAAGEGIMVVHGIGTKNRILYIEQNQGGNNMISMEMLQDARRVLSPVINQTPVLHAPGLVPDCDFYLKADCLQKTGAFKLRGAYYKIATLSDEEKRRGVIACSAGNHAQGVGFASRDMKIPATICIPAAAPISKIQATRSYGANVVLVDGVYDDAYAEAVRLRDEQGLTFIHPFDDYRVMAGQGTIGLEILEQLPDVDVILVPIGGGGLISGLAYAVKHLKPSCQVIGVQAAGAASMVDSLEAGHILTLPSVHTIADGIQVKTPGDLTFEMCRQYVGKVVAVSENEIAGAILSVLEKQKLVAEGAGAVGIAAAMYGKVDLQGKTVCALLSGGNVDVTMLERIMTRGLAKAGRTANFATVLPDQPKTLATLLNIMSDMGVNVLEVNHERGNLKAPVGSCVVHLLVETRDALHVQQMYETLRAQGYPIMER